MSPRQDAHQMEAPAIPLQEQVYQLFLLDKQVRAISRRVDASDVRLQVQQAKLEQLDRQHKELTQQVKQAQAKASSMEHESCDMDERVTHLRQQMNTAKNNKEYSALLIEVNTLKAQISKTDDGALEQMSQVDMLEQESAELAGTLAEHRKLVVGAEAGVMACREQFGQQLEKLTAQRDTADQELPQETRVTFHRLAQHNDGEALAEVIEEDRRSMAYTCGGCYMNIPVEHVNSLLARFDDLVCCTSCGRILYLDQALKAAICIK